MKEKILVTGGAGFIGTRLVRALVNKGYHVVILDNLSPQIHVSAETAKNKFSDLGSHVTFIVGDVTCRDDLVKSLQGVTSVVHLAAETGTGQSMYAIKHYTDVNVGGTALLLDIVANENIPVKKLVVASSRAVYGEGKYQCKNHGTVFPGVRDEKALLKGKFEHSCPYCGNVLTPLPTDEGSSLMPASVYGVTKLTQEQMVLSVGASLGISAIAFRYQNVYGAGQSLSNPYTGILSIFSTRIRNGKSFNIFEDGFESRDFVHVDDVVAATVLGIEKSEKTVDVFNVGSGIATTVLDVADSLQRLLGSKTDFSITGQYRSGDIRHNFCDLTKIESSLGFKPKITFENGLIEFAEWVKSEPASDDGYETSLKELADRGLIN